MVNEAMAHPQIVGNKDHNPPHQEFLGIAGQTADRINPEFATGQDPPKFSASVAKDLFLAKPDQLSSTGPYGTT
jgi:hypothetical protein